MPLPISKSLAKRHLAIPILAAALLGAAFAVLFAYQTLRAQEDPGCSVTSLGRLDAQSADGLAYSGIWSARDCESGYRPGNRARQFEFEVAAPGRVRIELTSNVADPYLYLHAGDGARIADDDDSGALLNARVELDLQPGTYRIEATTVGAATPAGADFGISIGYVAGCGVTPLGTLTPDSPLAAQGAWSLETCGSRIVVTHPAYNYLFEMPDPARVRIDLESANGDPVVSLATADGVAIGANDDGGVGLNSRIEQYLPAGTYIIEATTYSQGGQQPAASDFTLSVQVVDERAAQLDPNPKVEFLAVPDQVVSGDPFTVHFRVGNHGGGDLHGNAASYLVLVRGPENRHWGNPVPIAESTWAAGSSYHTGTPAASRASTELAGLASVNLRLEEPGRSWVLVALYALNENNRGLWFHATWKHVRVLESAELSPTLASVDGSTYSVAARADADGSVQTTVSNVRDRSQAVEPDRELQALYAAGARRLLLDGIFGREKIAALEQSRAVPAARAPGPDRVPLTPAGESSAARFAQSYLAAVSGSGLAAAAEDGYMPDPGAVEQLVLSNAADARAQYAALARDWRQLRSRTGGGGAITYAEALALHAQLRYAESVLDPAVRAGAIVAAARAADAGWDDAAVKARVAEYADDAACRGASGRFADALSAAVPGGAAAQLALDAELRTALPIFGAASDSALCATSQIDGANDRFFNLLGISPFDPAKLPGYRYVPDAEVSEARPYSLRILARRDADGRIEHAVELADGIIILPDLRVLEAGAAPGRAHHSSAVEVDGRGIGTIRSELDAEGLLRLSFQGSDGVQVVPRMGILPPGAGVGTWLRSSRIEVPAAGPALSRVG